MRKKLYIFVVLFMLFPFIPHHLSGAEAEEGTCGTNVKSLITAADAAVTETASRSMARTTARARRRIRGLLSDNGRGGPDTAYDS